MWLHASILKIYSIQCVCIWICLVLSQYTKADPLLNTDDTEIVPAKHCQLESAIIAPSHAETTYQFNTACQLIEGIETSLGYSDFLNSNEGHWSAQLKSVIRPMNGWGVAASLKLSGQQSEINQKDNIEWFLNIPFGLDFLNNNFHLYSNVGYQYASEQVHLLRWSVASNLVLSPRTDISLESYNQDRHAPCVQSALHYSLIPNILTFEASVGQRLDTFRERWFGFGLSFTP